MGEITINNGTEIFAVDRIEDALAVLETEDGGFVDFPLSGLPPGTRQGSVLRRNAAGVYSLDANEEARRRAENFALQEQLFTEQNNGG
ncbi:MAG: DUF3006 domain-containing protein [Oscillospiraceae bacterium]|jgi:hypothetical protein|nr:DUF3006 domain-containing protein [Oscillospiraceae bacterium]